MSLWNNSLTISQQILLNASIQKTKNSSEQNSNNNNVYRFTFKNQLGFLKFIYICFIIKLQQQSFKHEYNKR